MTEEIRLYDIREHNYPNRRGDHFRSLQVFECGVCGAITNEVIMGGAPGLGVRVLCPHSSECWHHDVGIKIQELRLEYRNNDRGFKEKVTEIRGVLKKLGIITDDIEGNPDLSLKRPVSNSFSRKKNCLHEFNSTGIYRLLDRYY